MMKKTKLGVATAAFAVLALVAAACSSTKSPSAGGTGQVSELLGQGASFPALLYQKWADEYKSKGVQVNYQSTGSGAGIRAIKAKTVDFGASDAPLSDKDLNDSANPDASNLIHIPTVFGGVSLIYNVPGVKTGLKLAPTAIANIFLGKIKNWNDPAIASENPGVSLPSHAITVAHRSDGSGTTYIFTSFLSAVSSDWKTQVGASTSPTWPTGLGGEKNPGVAQIVKGTGKATYAIGYVELIYATKNNLNVALVKNPAGKWIAPTLDSLKAATASVDAATVPDDLRFSIVNAPGDASYPICGPTYLLVYKEQNKSREPSEARARTLVNFLWWALHDGQADAEGLQFVKMPPALLTKVEAAIRSITYNGTKVYTG